MILHERIKKQEHTRFYVLLAMLALLLFVRYSLQLEIPRILLTGTIVLIALLGDRNEILAVAFCCIPWCEAVDIAYALFACAGSYLIKYYKEARINLPVILILAMVFWELLHCCEPNFSLTAFLFAIVTLIFLAVVLCLDVSKLNYAFLVRTMAVATAIICIVLLMQLIVRANFDIVSAIKGLRRLGLVSEDDTSSAVLGSAINPNSLGIICVLSVTGLLQLRTIGQGRKADIALTVILLVFGTLTSSRTFVVCLLIMTVLLTLAQPGNLRKKLYFISIVILLMGISILLLRWLFPDLLEYYLARFQTGELSGGRRRLQVIYHEYIMDNWNVLLFGIGRNNFHVKLTEIYRVARNMPHNMIQEIIVAWGVPGLIMFLLLFGMMIIRSRKFCHNQILLNFVPLVIIAAKSMAGQLLTSQYTMLALCYAYLSLCADLTPKDENRIFFQAPKAHEGLEINI